MERIEYFLPAVGTLAANLHKESASAYRFLKRHNLVDELQQNDQLGIIRHVWPSAHHTRWEYVCLVLDLIARLKSVQIAKVSAAIKLPGGGRVSSGTELLSSWMLLLNIGHLPWTFDAERALLLELADQHADAHRAEFLNAIEDPELQSWVADVIVSRQVFKFHQAVSLYRLYLIGRSDNDLDSLPWVAMAKAYLLPKEADPEALIRARVLLKTLRRIAFLTLDSANTPSVMTVSLPRLINHSESFERVLRRALFPTGRGDELASLDEYLSVQVYGAKPVVTEVAAREGPLRQIIRSDLATGLRHAIQQLITGQTHDRVQRESIYPVLRLQYRNPGHVAPQVDRALAPDAQEDIVKTMVSEGATDFRLHARRDPDRRFGIIQAHAHTNSHASGAACLAFGLRHLARLRQAVQAGYGDALVTAGLRRRDATSIAARQFEGLVEDALSECLRAALHHFFRRPFLVEFVTAVDGPPLAFGTKQEARERLVGIAESHPDAVGSFEINGLQRAMSHLPSSAYVLPLVSVRLVTPGGGDEIAELDGLAFTVDELKGDVVLAITETKQRRSGGGRAAARTAMNRKLTVLKPVSGVRVSSTRVREDAPKIWTARVTLRASYGTTQS